MRIWSARTCSSRVGNDMKAVKAVALYEGSAPGARVPGGSESYANYVAQVEERCA